jgi:hypothetical protein
MATDLCSDKVHAPSEDSVARGIEREPNLLSVSGPALIDLMQPVLAEGRSLRFCAKGWSMAPFVRDGDVICVSPLSQAGPSVGEVVAFIRADTGQLVVHRVIAREGESYAIRGDNTPGMGDGAVRRQNILGRVTSVTRNGREVGLGLGPERRLIALLSRAGWLLPLRDRLAPLFRPLLRRRLR